MFKYLLILWIVSISALGQNLDPRFVRAIHLVETGGRYGDISGDNGAAKGSLQIHYAYWKDAIDFDKSIGGKYSDCKDHGYSVKVMSAYLRRYAKNAILAKDYETLARIHNGGLNGHKKSATLGYWQKVKKHL